VTGTSRDSGQPILPGAGRMLARPQAPARPGQGSVPQSATEAGLLAAVFRPGPD
jgi:hypothetical protein